MKRKILEVHFRSLDDMKKDMDKAIRTRIPQIQPRHHLYWDSLESFRNFLTTHKLELLSAIANWKPKSLYELAKMVNRDVASIQRECKILENTGFIKFSPSKHGKRRSKQPKLKFDYSAILVFVPRRTFQIPLWKKAA